MNRACDLWSLCLIDHKSIYCEISLSVRKSIYFSHTAMNSYFYQFRVSLHVKGTFFSIAYIWLVSALDLTKCIPNSEIFVRFFFMPCGSTNCKFNVGRLSHSILQGTKSNTYMLPKLF